MDPLTLFALANGAVAAVKKGCQLYKDIKGAAGDVRGVLKDLDEQFHGAYAAKGKTPSSEAKKQLVEEKNKIIELNKKSNDVPNIYNEIGEYLGTYFDNYYKCMAVLEEEERRSENEVYTGDASLGKRALQRVLMKKQLQQMGAELQELMIYQSPVELGALWTEVSEMMQVMGRQQKYLITKKMMEDDIKSKKRAKKIEFYKLEFGLIITGIFLLVALGIFWTWLYYDAKEKGHFANKTQQKKYEVIRKKETEKIKQAIERIREEENRGEQ